MKNTLNEDNAIRAVLRNELTWGLFIVGAVWSMVVWVILPLNNLQSDVTQIKSDIAEIKLGEKNNLLSHSGFENRLTRLEVLIK